jgi:DNA polymerase-4
VVPPNHLYYHDLSHRLHHFLRRRIPKVEQFSIDEFFGDVRGWVAPQETEEFLRSLQSEIADRFGLPISIGAARSKWTAKLATSFAKPKGVKVVRDVESFIQNIPVEKFPGIGRGYLRRLRGYGIRTLGETKGAKELFYAWKKPGITLYKRIWGIDGEPVEPVSPRKSVGISRTIDPLTDRAELERRVTILSRYLAAKIARLGLEPSWYALSLRYECGLKSGAHTRSHRLFGERLLIETMRELLKRCDIHTDSKVVRIGIRVWGFEERKVYDLTTLAQDRKDRKLLRSCTALRSRYGINKIRWARELMQKEGPKRARKWG